MHEGACFGKGLMLKTNKNHLFIMTAAHVAVGATGARMVIDNQEHTVQVAAAFIHKNYIVSGHPDLAILRAQDNAPLCAALPAKRLVIARNIDIRHELSSVERHRFFKGDVTEVSFERPLDVTAGAASAAGGAGQESECMWMRLSGITSMPGDSGSPMVTTAETSWHHTEGLLGGLLHGVSLQTSKTKRQMSSTTDSSMTPALHPILYVTPLGSLEQPKKHFVSIPVPSSPAARDSHLYAAVELLEMMPPTFSAKQNPLMTVADYKSRYAPTTEAALSPSASHSPSPPPPPSPSPPAADKGVLDAIAQLDAKIDAKIDGLGKKIDSTRLELATQISSMRGCEVVERPPAEAFTNLRHRLTKLFETTEEDLDAMTIKQLFIKLLEEANKNPFPDLAQGERLPLAFRNVGRMPVPQMRRCCACMGEGRQLHRPLVCDARRTVAGGDITLTLSYTASLHGSK
ncbi:unnamed protein product [Vitrella brassicaformis CCMP3155]|uniref:Peptidase S1 domain-containing protein n=1 Tax=Vitrella brassicaformis (strain CCMP3155) TaxID=1169540 RepID=A0A0G4G775_VITBC|nr:unnamed protein product [Vitrella brassicaformis CCMP3155]|eukprot:CEM24079.1 unnamed protein product [Vitrella brassicaformis CCMP3155]